MIPLGVLSGSRYTPPFSPLSLTNLNLWVDASDLPDGPVALWPDKSGLGNHAVQTTASKQPVKNSSGVFFDPTLAQVIDSPATTSGDQQCAFVVAAPADTVVRTVFCGQDSRSFSVDFNNKRPQIRLWGVSTAVMNGYSKPVNVPVAVAAVYDYIGGSIRVISDVVPGVSQSSAGSVLQAYANRYTRIGTKGSGAEYFHGTILEIVKCSSIPSESDILNMMNYFAAKWGTNPF